MAVPDTTTFSLQDVVNEVNPTTNDLVDCIADAITGQYDPAYFTAPATNLLEFRNYGAITSEGPLFPGTGATVSDSGSAWSNPTRIQSDSGGDAGSSASTFAAASGSTDLLRGTNFGFAVGGTPVGIEVTIHRAPSAGGSGDIDDNSVQLVLSGTPLGTSKSDGTWADGYNTITYGGPTDLWGATPSTANVNSSGFGVQLKADNTDVSLGNTMFVESMTMTIYW